MSDNTIFDSVFKTMVHRSPQLMVPFINEVFGRSYPEGTEVVPFSNEHEGVRGTIIDDSVFRLGEKIYHIECQSTPDSNMVIRMIEYDFAIALEGALSAGAPYEMDFPASCVLFLRDTPSTPDVLTMRVNLPNGESFEYQAQVVKAQRYTDDDIFQKRLLLLLPYYLMRYERELSRIATSGEEAERLIAECYRLRMSLESTVLSMGETVLYEELVELIIRVSDYLLASHEALRKRVREAMGGEVLELWRDRAERLEREARERGLEEGREEGLEQGLEQGREQTVAEMSAALKERGINPSVLDEVAAEIRSGKRAVQ